MVNSSEQPSTDDPALGGQVAAPCSGVNSAGIEGVKQRLKSTDEAVRLGALQSALEYGEVGFDLVIAALRDKCGVLAWTACTLLEQRTELKAEEALRNYGFSHSYKVVTVNEQGRVIRREHKKVRVFREQIGNTVLDLVPISAGHFVMGSLAFEKERRDRGLNIECPQHEVRVDLFWMGQYPITQAQSEAFIGENSSYFKGAKHPVERVNWYKAMEFCDRLSRRTGSFFPSTHF